MTIFGFIGVLGRHPAYYQSRGTCNILLEFFASFKSLRRGAGCRPVAGCGGCTERPPAPPRGSRRRRARGGPRTFIAPPAGFAARNKGRAARRRGGGRS